MAREHLKEDPARQDGIVLLHGIARRSGSLEALENALQADGYRTLNLDYPARSHNIEDIVAFMREPVVRFGAELDGELHFVTHSMGGLVARAYVNRHRPERLGRVVMLAPPNEGSEIADLLGNNALFRAFFGPAGSELGTERPEALCEVLGGVDYPLGVIAGDRSFYPIGSLMLAGANDGRVSVERTKVAGMADHITIHATHPLIMRNREAIAQTRHFLKHGRFERSEIPA
ncbi:MAG TPA: alpha/beta fold hydrolase [Bosea sp. (in: a-proteobacteria)]|jgi:pimeloyl-ACP methyl ester carboxylesterase|uniref:esterase/lipase family protein n=1 Tax=Bosea sp. (in: a-proteobacteria) TaxID=1871050 RepID=UPI002E13AC47|nr:alpha/beta fold hydrolase [Bosea sp. (in: a-proteobacteria)]